MSLVEALLRQMKEGLPDRSNEHEEVTDLRKSRTPKENLLGSWISSGIDRRISSLSTEGDPKSSSDDLPALWYAL